MHQLASSLGHQLPETWRETLQETGCWVEVGETISFYTTLPTQDTDSLFVGLLKILS